MPDFPRSRVSVLPQFISTYGRYGTGLSGRLIAGTGAFGAQTWITNATCYVPMAIPFAYPVNRVWWINGSTVASTSAEFGIYTIGGSKIYSTGSVAMSGASVVQYVTPTTPFMLAADVYYFAWTCTNTTSRAYSAGFITAANARLMGLLQQSVTPQPASWTPASWTLACAPELCGITRTGSGF